MSVVPRKPCPGTPTPTCRCHRRSRTRTSRGTVALTVETVGQAGLRPDQLAAVFLVGGSSRIPLVARLVYQRLGIIPTTLDQPETVVPRGALRAVSLDPLPPGGLPEQRTAVMAAGPAPTSGMLPPPAVYPPLQQFP